MTVPMIQNKVRNEVQKGVLGKCSLGNCVYGSKIECIGFQECITVYKSNITMNLDPTIFLTKTKTYYGVKCDGVSCCKTSSERQLWCYDKEISTTTPEEKTQYNSGGMIIANYFISFIILFVVAYLLL
jgi:hypothetical protein